LLSAYAGYWKTFQQPLKAFQPQGAVFCFLGGKPCPESMKTAKFK
jgi:hypothetical protein